MLFNRMLVNRHYLLEDKTEKFDKKTCAYYNAYLLSNFGIILSKPEKATLKMIKDISGVLALDVPKSFYNNPQDLKYYTKEELFVEQLVSYIMVNNFDYFDHISIFKKNLPEYLVGNELVLRTFTVISEEQAQEVLLDIFNAYCDYTRPFSLDELEEFKLLFKSGFYNGQTIKCRDNILTLLQFDISFARFLDKKDLVKLSISSFGDYHTFCPERGLSDNLSLIKQALPLVRSCPLSKKQAKYYNKLVKYCGLDLKLESNIRSPYKAMQKALKANKVVEAARICANNGSLLERNIKYLLSRANPLEATEIINMLPADNPFVLYQLVLSIATKEEADNRVFTFTKNNRVKRHIETDYEARWRKSRLNSGTKDLLHDIALNKLFAYYRDLPSLGKIYIADDFYKIGLPINTSANGKGLDVLPAGSRVMCTSKNIRTFVYWNGIRDVDSSLIALNDEGDAEEIYFGNYSSKPFGNSILFSGDDRGFEGAEYFDVKLADLVKKGYTKIIQAFNGYGDTFDKGTVMCGYQNKDNLETEVWDPKNIEMQFRISGKSRSCVAFGIDLKTSEIVIINTMLDSDERVIDTNITQLCNKYFDSKYLEVNIGVIAGLRGQVVETPEEADVVLDNHYINTSENEQTVLRAYEVEKLVSFISK